MAGIATARARVEMRRAAVVCVSSNMGRGGVIRNFQIRLSVKPRTANVKFDLACLHAIVSSQKDESDRETCQTLRVIKEDSLVCSGRARRIPKRHEPKSNPMPAPHPDSAI
jgi:hypothetical protein